MKGSNYAWVILISKEDDIAKAILSAVSLKQTKTSGSVVALVEAQLSRNSLSQIEFTFDWTIFGQTAGSDKNKNDFLFVECWKLSAFSGVVALQPGVIVLTQMDELFDAKGLLLSDQGSLLGVALHPCQEIHSKLSNSFQECGGSIIEATTLCFTSGYEAKEIGRIFTYSSLIQSFPSKDILTQVLVYVENVKELVACKPTSFSYLKEFEAKFYEIYKETLTQTDERICVVGMSCRFPGANNPMEFWDLLVSGGKVDSPKLKCKTEEFDASFFNMSTAEASFTDPQARLLMECSWEAFEDAGINPDKLRGRNVAVFCGTGKQIYKDMLNEKIPNVEEYLRNNLGNSFESTAANLLSFFYGWTGSNVSVDNTDSSTLVGIDLACKSLQKRESSVALVAGTNLLLTEKEEGKAEGVAVLVLKRYSDAVKDNDQIYGIVRGCGRSKEEGMNSTSSGKSQVAAMKNALLLANVSGKDVDYIETHFEKDAAEIAAISEVYPCGNKALWVGSIKGNIGDTEAVSGLAGILKVLLAMKYEMLPLQTNEKPLTWPRSSRKARLAGVSSFGTMGTYAHVILEEAPPLSPENKSIQEPDNVNSFVILTMSGKSEQSLRDQCSNIKTFLEKTRDNIWDIAYTSNACRAHHQHRTAFVGSSTSEILKEMQKHKEENGLKGKQKPTICFTFPGLTGKMNLTPIKHLYSSSPYFRLRMDICASTVERIFGASMSMKSVLIAKDYNLGKYPLGLVEATVIAAQYCLAQLWKHWGILPDAVIGHCLGELPAAILSGLLSIENGLEMIIKYMQISPNALPGTMLAINANNAKTTQLINEFMKDHPENGENWLEIACVNNDLQITVAGSSLAIAKFKSFCTGRQLRCTIIPVGFAMHSRALDPLYDDFKQIAEKFSIGAQQVPYISSVAGKPISESDLKPDHYANCFRYPVNFVETCKTASQMEINVYLEIGFDGILSKITERNITQFIKNQPIPLFLPSLKPTGTLDPNGVLQVPLTSLANIYMKGVDINWENFYQCSYPLRKVHLPLYPFQRKSFYSETIEEKKTKQG